MNESNEENIENTPADFSSKWHVIKEKRKFLLSNGRGEIYEVTGIKRDDGLTITRESAMRNAEVETFLYKGSFGEFKFSASRWDMHKGIMNTYIVYLFSPYIEKGDEILVRSMSKDIESALLHFPVSKHFNNKSIESVVFQVNKGYSLDTVLRAGEV